MIIKIRAKIYSNVERLKWLYSELIRRYFQMRNVIFRFSCNRIRVFEENVFESRKVVEKKMNEVV